MNKLNWFESLFSLVFLCLTVHWFTTAFFFSETMNKRLQVKKYNEKSCFYDNTSYLKIKCYEILGFRPRFDFSCVKSFNSILGFGFIEFRVTIGDFRVFVCFFRLLFISLNYPIWFKSISGNSKLEFCLLFSLIFKSLLLSLLITMPVSSRTYIWPSTSFHFRILKLTSLNFSRTTKGPV